jgi:hypothetical protein
VGRRKLGAGPPKVYEHIIAIDPGTDKSGYVEWSMGKIAYLDTLSNDKVRTLLSEASRLYSPAPMLAIEWPVYYGRDMQAGQTIFKTCAHVGRFVEVWPGQHVLVPRKKVVAELCETAKVGDPEVRRACVDILGEPPTKANPNSIYTRRPASHEWAAIALALAFNEMTRDGRHRALEVLA